MFKLQQMIAGPVFFSAPPGKAARARQRLLQAALLIFGERGYESATVREIASGAGQNVAAIAYHFGNKEKLYRELVRAIVDEMKRRMGDILERVRKMGEEAQPSPEAARALLEEFFQALYLRILSRNEAVAIGRIVIREQLTPTIGFEVLYPEGFRVLHEAVAYLLGAALNRDPRDRDTIIRAHALMGQVYFFTVAREAVLRRVGWKDLEGRNAARVIDIIIENIRLLTNSASAAGP